MLSFLFSCLIALTPSQKDRIIVKDTVFHVEVMRTDAEWERGLMYREKLGKREGMIFFGNNDRILEFWMKNTPLSLDIIFIDKEGRVVSTIENAEPLSEKIVKSTRPARHALEVRAGTVKELKIKEADAVHFQFATKDAPLK